MKILVTGGAGSIGSNLVKKLVSLNYEVFVVDNLWRGKLDYLNESNIPSINLKTNFLNLDLRDYNNCIIASEGMDLVIHLADIVAGINYVFNNEYSVYRNNTIINSNMLHASIKNNVPNYLYIGTACSYPKEKQQNINITPLFREDDVYPANPESSYGWSKLMGEYECEIAQKNNLINIGILRFHNVYGPPCEYSIEKSQVIPALCRKAANYPIEDFVVWGSGNQKRAFLYIDDAVDAIILMLEKGFNKGAIQIGPSISHSINDIAQRIINISGKNIKILNDIKRPEGDTDRAANIEKAQSILGWSAKVSLDEGLNNTYHWVQKEIGRLTII